VAIPARQVGQPKGRSVADMIISSTAVAPIPAMAAIRSGRAVRA
jgi:hypothetical protein